MRFRAEWIKIKSIPRPIARHLVLRLKLLIAEINLQVSAPDPPPPDPDRDIRWYLLRFPSVEDAGNNRGEGTEPAEVSGGML